MVIVKDVPVGDYVVSAFHDADTDDRIGFAASRMTERSALSNAQAMRGPPSFAVDKIAVESTGSVFALAMSYPTDRKAW